MIDTQNAKLVICIRDAKGRPVKPVNPFDMPADVDATPEAVRIAAEAVRQAFQPTPVNATVCGARASVAATIEVGEHVQPSGKGQGRRGRPTGYKCSPETKAAMAEAKRAMWNRIHATMAEIEA